MDKGPAKKAWGILGCAVCWTFTAFLALLEAFCTYLWVSGTLYVMKWGAEENPYAAEDAWAAGVFSAVTAVPLLLMLGLSIYVTIKLGKRGKQCEHSMPGK